MAHLAPLSRDDPSDLAPLYEFVEQAMGFLPNSLLTMARWPELVRAFVPLAGLVNGPGHVPTETKRLVAFVSSRAAGCRYCQAHTSHGAAERGGVAAEKIERAFEFETSPLFDEADCAALRFARDASLAPSCIDASHFGALRKHFDERQIVELAAVVALFGFLNRWNDAFATPLEAEPLRFAEQHLTAQGWAAGKHAR